LIDFPATWRPDARPDSRFLTGINRKKGNEMHRFPSHIMIERRHGTAVIRRRHPAPRSQAFTGDYAMKPDQRRHLPRPCTAMTQRARP